MPILSEFAQKKKIDYFIKNIDKNSKILEIGCGSLWLKKYMQKNGWTHYTGIDINPPADIVGDIRDWKLAGLKKGTFDYIIAFEVVEHADIFKECYELLKDNGQLLVTTPIPYMDWVLRLFEKAGLNQKRTSPHTNLIYLDKLKSFIPIEIKKIAFLSQWGILKRKEDIYQN